MVIHVAAEPRTVVHGTVPECKIHLGSYVLPGATIVDVYQVDLAGTLRQYGRTADGTRWSRACSREHLADLRRHAIRTLRP